MKQPLTSLFGSPGQVDLVLRRDEAGVKEGMRLFFKQRKDSQPAFTFVPESQPTRENHPKTMAVINSDSNRLKILTIIFDHNVIDGAPAARFTRRLVELIERGYGLDSFQASIPEARQPVTAEGD